MTNPITNPVRSDSESTPMITPWEVTQHVFCPRFTWFMNVQNILQHEEARYKVMKGREIHQRRETENKEYLRSKIGVIRKEIAVYLASPRLRLRGVVDEVLWLQDGSMAPLDYKYTPAQEVAFKTHRMQIVLYSLLITDIYRQPVTRGYLGYIRDGSTLIEVPITPEDIQSAQHYVAEIFDIIATGRLPARTAHRVRCVDCCYKNICV